MNNLSQLVSGRRQKPVSNIEASVI